MKKLILNLALSLDGFIEGQMASMTGVLPNQDYGLSDFLDGIDAC
ncbi:MAG: hypothetical protein U0103_25355 [Candidatus Obscuribacterales bacterium]